MAPEHISAPVLSLMGKPEHRIYEEFTRQFKKMNESSEWISILSRTLCLLIRGSTLKEAVELAGILPKLTSDICWSRCRIFIRHLLRFQLACIIRESIRAPVSLFLFRNPRMKKKSDAARFDSVVRDPKHYDRMFWKL